MPYENPWTYRGEIVDDNVPEDAVSFVYLITNTTNNRKYIGKKVLVFRKTQKPLKGKKRKRKSYHSSGWREYYGSSVELNSDVATFGNDKFTRQILRFCKSKGEASYWEAKYIFENDAILSEDYYNQSIMVRVHRSHIK